MRIGLISALYPPLSIGGAERMTAQLCEGLEAQGMDVRVLSLAAPGKALPVQPHVSRLPLRNLYWPYDRSQPVPPAWQRLTWHVLDTANPWMSREVLRWARDQQLDLICTNNLQGFSTAIWPALKTLGLPLVHVLHDFSLLCPRTILFRNGQRCGLQQQRCRECRWLSVPRAGHTRALSAVVGVSQSILALHQTHGLFGGLRTQVIYNALDDEQLGRAPLPLEPGQRLRLGFLGRLDVAKGLDTLMAAAHQLQQQGSPVELVVGGRGQAEDVASWQALYPHLSVQWRGHIAPDTLWPDIDVLVFPSASLEALGNVVLEAGAAGRASVVSRHGGAVELVEQHVSGDWFEPGDPADLASVLARLSADPARLKSMGLAAHQKAQAHTRQRRVQAFLALFEDVLHAHRATH